MGWASSIMPLFFLPKRRKPTGNGGKPRETVRSSACLPGLGRRGAEESRGAISELPW